MTATSLRSAAIFAPLYPPAFRGGGPIRSISALVASAPPEFTLCVLTSDRDLGIDGPLPVIRNLWQTSARADVYYATWAAPRLYVKALFAVRKRRPRLLHLNSFMNFHFSIVPVLLWKFRFWGKSLVLLSPRGEFGASALGRRQFKKRAYMRVFRLLGLHNRVIWHSTAPHETIDIRRIWGESVTIIERENDATLAASAMEPIVQPGPLRAVFVGRIVEHKGLDIALLALADVASPVHLDVYGSREDDAYALRCEARAASLPSHIGVTFHGPLSPDRVIEMLSEHDTLLMPTAGENFGHVILEALSASCSVAVTPDTPWTDELGDAGLILERSPEAWTKGIEALASEPAAARLARRLAAGRAYERWIARPRRPHVWATALGLVTPSYPAGDGHKR